MTTSPFSTLSRFNNLKKLSIRNYAFSIFCFLILFGNGFINHVDARLTLYDKENNEIDSLDNFDLLFLKNSDTNNIDYYNDDVTIRGKIEFAEFIEDGSSSDSSSCTLKPIPIGAALLVIPFGNDKICNTFSELIFRNKWITHDLTLPDSYQNGLPEGTTILPDGTYSIPQNNSQPKKRTFSKISKHLINRNQIDNKILMKKRGDPIFGVPQVILFTSSNNGDPGIKEPFAADHDLFKNVKMAVTLILRNDMSRLESLTSTIDHVSITSDAGPWMRLINSQYLLAWTINLGATYGVIFVFTIYTIIRSFDSWDLVPKNQNIYILPGIAFSSLASLIVLVVDPDNIRERFSLIGYTLFTGFNSSVLNLLHVMLLYLWVRAAREITLFDSHLSPIVRFSTRIHRHILYLNILLIWATFIFHVLGQTSSHIQNLSVVWEISFIALMNMGFLSFGMFMILALATDREVKQKIGQSLVFEFSNKADIGKAIKVIVVMMILMISFSFLNISNVIISSLSPTVSNFWVSRKMNDISTSLSMISILSLLRSKSFSRYLVNPSSSLLTSRPSSRSLVPTPEQVAEDERMNSAAYTRRTTVVRPEPSYKMNPNRISVEVRVGMNDIGNSSSNVLINNNDNDNNNTGAITGDGNNNGLRVNNNNLFLKSEGNSKFDVIDL